MGFLSGCLSPEKLRLWSVELLPPPSLGMAAVVLSPGPPLLLEGPLLAEPWGHDTDLLLKRRGMGWSEEAGHSLRDGQEGFVSFPKLLSSWRLLSGRHDGSSILHPYMVPFLYWSLQTVGQTEAK